MKEKKKVNRNFVKGQYWISVKQRAKIKRAKKVFKKTESGVIRDLIDSHLIIK